MPGFFVWGYGCQTCLSNHNPKQKTDCSSNLPLGLNPPPLGSTQLILSSRQTQRQIAAAICLWVCTPPLGSTQLILSSRQNKKALIAESDWLDCFVPPSLGSTELILSSPNKKQIAAAICLWVCTPHYWMVTPPTNNFHLLANCPHAASISFPRLLRNRAFTRCFSR